MNLPVELRMFKFFLDCAIDLMLLFIDELHLPDIVAKFVKKWYEFFK